MILQALTAYYEQLVRQGKLSAPGWDDSFKVSYELRLNDAGQLLRVVPLLTEKTVGKKTVLAPRAMRVPAHEKRSSGFAANFLCDNSTYLLGADEKGKPERSADCFKACAKLHHAILDGVDSPAARALLAYFDSWDPAQAATNPLLQKQWKEITGNANLIFGYEAADHSHSFVNDDPAIQNAWQTHYNDRSADSDMGQCLITGKYAPIERTHPNISGVPGAQSSGAALVSFNAPAFCSYGHEQGDNAPVSKYAAFAYTTALNRLLADRSHCKHVGDTAILCWAENAEPVYQDAMSMFLFGADEAAGIQESDVQAALKRLSAGQTVPFLEKELSPDQHFYLLGLAPNIARLSVRFFLRDTFGSFAQNLQKHADEMEIDCSEKEKFRSLPIWAVVNETTRTVPGQPAKPSPQLAGDLLRAVLTGAGYRHYEISSFARPGFESRHNSSYWKGVRYLGVGPAAHSFDGDRRRWNVSDVREYLRKEPEGTQYETEEITPKDAYNEFVMTGLRTDEGIDSRELSARFGARKLQYFVAQAEKFVAQGNIVQRKSVYCIPAERYLISDSIISDLFDVE